MIFNYKVKGPEGVIQKGAVEAASEKQASAMLYRHGLTVLSLEPEEVTLPLDSFFPFLNRVSRKELVLFSRQFATLINSKVPIIQSLDILSEQISSKKLREAIGVMASDIEGGKKLSDSISKFPNIFSSLYINLIRSGELSGSLDESLTFLADQEERDYDLASKIKGAMTYPIFIVSAIVIVGGLMFTFVLPQMIGMLQEAEVELPVTTKILIFLTDAIQNYWWLMAMASVGVVVGFHFYVRSPAGRFVWDQLKIKTPIMGPLLRNIYMSRFSRNLATLVIGGIPIVKSLNTVAEIVGNTIYKNIIKDAAKQVETGKSMADVFEKENQMPKIVTQMVRIGEQTGSLGEILGKLADFYDKEVERTLNTLTTLLEPIIMLLLGMAVAVMVAGILLPIYNLASI